MADFYCKVCDNLYHKKPSRNNGYCSHLCYTTFHRGENHVNFKREGSRNSAGYRLVTVDGERVYLHRHLMEQKLGRKLTSEEVVHHKDHNKENNDIDNLELMPSNSAHRIRHGGFRNETHKQCNKCLEIKPRTEFFRVNQKGRDSHISCCKPCYMKRHYELRASKAV